MGPFSQILSYKQTENVRAISVILDGDSDPDSDDDHHQVYLNELWT